MKSSYVVKHSHPNPRHNQRLHFTNKKDAVAELKSRSGDRDSRSGVGTSTLYKNNETIAFRAWDQSRATWI